MKRWRLYIKGGVQGVWYRLHCQNKALELGLTGFVQNQADGSVYAEGQGDEHSLKQWLKWCEQGPPLAAVQEVIQESIPLVENEPDFTIRR